MPDNNSNQTAGVQSTGSIGDVKFSVLGLEDFIKENGTGWVLMNDQWDMNNQEYLNSTLYMHYHIQKVPDARGVFIRGLNLGRDVSSGDSTGDRSAGDYQQDSFKSHNHTYNAKNLEADRGSGFQGWGFQSNSSPNYQLFPMSTEGDKETRPRNIALYIYIRIK